MCLITYEGQFTSNDNTLLSETFLNINYRKFNKSWENKILVE